MAQTIHADYARSDAGFFERMALAITDWSERWYPDAFVFAVMAIFVVALGCLAVGARPDLDRAVIRRRLLVNHPLYVAGLRWCCDRLCGCSFSARGLADP